MTPPGANEATDPTAANELVLAVALAATVAFGLVAACVLALGHTETTEKAGYLAGAAAVVAGVALARTLTRRGGSSLAVVGAVGVAIIAWGYWGIARHDVLTSDGAALAVLVSSAMLVAGTFWWLRRPAGGGLAAGDGRGAVLAAIGVLALAAAVVPFTPTMYHSAGRLAPAALVAVAVAAALMAWRWRTPTWLRVGVDVGVCALLLALVNDLQYHPGAQPGNDVLHHLNFYLGPVNDVLNGRAVLVDTYSQYGVGVIYAIAAGYRLTGTQLSYGSFELLIGVLTALWLCCIYILLRLSTRSQAIAIVTVAVIVLANVFNSYSFTSYPMAGALRFAPPFVVLLALVIEQRWRRPPWFGLSLAALVSLWSIETFVYTLGAVLAFLACAAWLSGGSPRERIAAGVANAARLLAATLVVHAVFAVVTRVAAGAWPDWSTYVDYVRVYATGDFGSLLIAPFSPGLAIGLMLLASAVAVVVLAMRDEALAPIVREWLPVLAALTALGVVTYTYFLGRSAPGVEPKIAVSMIVLAGIWTDLAIGVSRPRVRGPGFALTAAVCLTAALVVHSAWPAFKDGWRRTALAALVGKSLIVAPSDPSLLAGQVFPATLQGRIKLLRASPVASDHAQMIGAEELIRRYGAGGHPLAVLLGPEITTEALVRRHRANALPIASPTEDALLPSAYERISAAAGRLPSGTVLITDQNALAGRPAPPAPQLVPIIQQAQGRYVTLRQRLLGYLREHFILRRLAVARGLVAARLERR